MTLKLCPLVVVRSSTTPSKSPVNFDSPWKYSKTASMVAQFLFLLLEGPTILHSHVDKSSYVWIVPEGETFGGDLHNMDSPPDRAFTRHRSDFSGDLGS